MFKVTYHYSACVSIQTGDVKILCDPWFTDGAYDGSWYQFPKLLDPVGVIGPVDYIYISHIHPDHYDPVFLREYLQTHSGAKVMIANFSPNFLAKKMEADGIPFQILAGELTIKETSFRIFVNGLNPNDIDSAFAVKHNGRSFVNMNDNLFNPAQLDAILEFCQGTELVLAGLTYTGAGPYPQTYYPLDSSEIIEKAKEKKNSFFQRYIQMRDYLNPTHVLPFAGKYHLGGKLTHLNQFRGVSDPVEVKSFCDKAVVLGDSGRCFFDLENGKASGVREDPYAEEEILRFYDRIKAHKFAYEKHFENLPMERVNLRKIMEIAFQNAIRKSNVEEDYYFIFELPSGFVVFNLNRNLKEFFFSKDLQIPKGRHSWIKIDTRLLFGLLIGLYHWNNAEVGSLYFVTRNPDVHDRNVQGFLNFFHL